MIFLGACNVYRRFVEGYEKVSRPLTEILWKDAEMDWENPTADKVAAFEILKEIISSPPVMSLPKANRPLLFDTDASNYAIVTVFLQQKDPNDAKSWETVWFWSKYLNPADKYY